jgi:uncharacterized protein
MINRLLISGGTGFIGRRLASRWMQMGRQVTLVTRTPARPLPGLETAARVGWDGRSLPQDALDGIDAVVNLAGENIGAERWSTERLHRILQSRVDAGTAFTDAYNGVKDQQPVFVQASAVGYYGTSHEASLTEISPAGGDTLAGIALAWENSTAPLDDLGVRRLVIRTGVVLAAESGSALARLALPVRLFAGGPLGSGRQWLSWIHWQDEIEAIIFLLEHPQAQGAYNLTAPVPLQQRDFSRELAAVMHRPYWVPAPGFALRLALGEMSTLVLDGQKVLPQRLLEAGYTFRYPGAREALKQIYSK